MVDHVCLSPGLLLLEVSLVVDLTVPVVAVLGNGRGLLVARAR